MADGMDELGRAVADGRLGFGETLDMLMAAHIRMFGTPNTRGGIYRLEARISERLVGLAEQHTDPRLREWQQPRLVQVDIKNDWETHRPKDAERDRSGVER